MEFKTTQGHQVKLHDSLPLKDALYLRNFLQKKMEMSVDADGNSHLYGSGEVMAEYTEEKIKKLLAQFNDDDKTPYQTLMNQGSIQDYDEIADKVDEKYENLNPGKASKG